MSDSPVTITPMTDQGSFAFPAALLTTVALGELALFVLPKGFAGATASGDMDGANVWAGIAFWFREGGVAPLLVSAAILLLVLLLCWASWQRAEKAICSMRATSK
jgi:hypothetical protein